MKNLLLLFFIFHYFSLLAQDQKMQVNLLSVHKIDAEIFVGIDGLGNHYYIKNNVLFKKHLAQLWQYKNPSLGTITRVDIENPLNIVLFYQNFNTVILLDNQLNETQKINFSENETPILATAVGVASQNRIWIYNSLTQRIGLLDYLKNNYIPVGLPFQGTIIYYDSHYNSFEWIDEKFNWFSCDLFGRITSLVKVPDFDQIQILSKSSLVYRKNNSLFYFTLEKSKSYFIELDKKSFINFFAKDQNLTIFTSEEITNYKIIIP